MRILDIYVSKVTSRGQVTIPQQLREKDEITSDDYITMRKVGKYIVMSKASIRMDEITKEFEKEAKARKITKRGLLDELKIVQKQKYK